MCSFGSQGPQGIGAVMVSEKSGGGCVGLSAVVPPLENQRKDRYYHNRDKDQFKVFIGKLASQEVSATHAKAYPCEAANNIEHKEP